MRIPEDGDNKYSIGDLELVDCNRLKNYKFDRVRVKEHKKKILNSLISFKNEVFISFINKSQKTFDSDNLDDIKNIERKIEEFYEKYKKLENETVDYYNTMQNYDNFEDIDVDIFIEIFYFLEFLEIKNSKDSEEIKEKEKVIIEEKNSEIKFPDPEKKEKKDNEKKENVKKEVENEKKEKIQEIEKEEIANISILLVLSFVIDLNEKYEKEILKIKDIKTNIKDKLLLIKAYNKKFIESIRARCNINFIETLNIETENTSHAYIRAIKFIRNIIEKLEEKSRLFEIFLYLDSDKFENILINNIQHIETIKDHLGQGRIIEYNKNPTEYGINMLNIDEVKTHLLNLIPKYIIRICTEMKFNATYDQESKIMFLNEQQLFKVSSDRLSKFFKNKNVNKIYVLPLAMEILHELFGHGKLRFIDNKTRSPEEYRDSKYNFRRRFVKKKIDDNKVINFPESGIVLENYISENRTIIRWLKTVHEKKEEQKMVEKILDANFWVDKDFSKL